MQIITVNLPKQYVDVMHILSESGLYPSRSEIIRQALHDFIDKEIANVATMVEAVGKYKGGGAVKRLPPRLPGKEVDMRGGGFDNAAIERCREALGLKKKDGEEDG